MHIPLCQTKDIELNSFDEDLIKSKKQNDIYDVNKWIFVPSYYTEYRYILGTIGKKPLICIGINPSTASPDNLDNTLKSVERIAINNGFDSFIMFNVYAQRATNPNDMDISLNKKLHNENMKAFEYILSLSRDCKPSIWAAWGTIIEKRDYLYSCLSDMINIGRKYDASWFTAGKKSKQGQPHHPLYLKKDIILDEFDVESYYNEKLFTK